MKKLANLPDFPASACTNKDYVELTLRGAQSTYDLMNKLNSKVPKVKIYELSNLHFESNAEAISIQRLKEKFDYYGSDKASTHNYHELYNKIFSRTGKIPQRILEIGIGSNNRSIPSTMGPFGKPGASMRAWRSLADNVEVIGLDIDESILFQEDGIHTYLLDQTSEESWQAVMPRLNALAFDLIIDDGLHAPFANIFSILMLKNNLSITGTYVVEDIHERALPIWQLVGSLMQDEFESMIIGTKSEYCYVFWKHVKS